MAKFKALNAVYEFETPAELKSAQVLTEGNIQFIKTQLALTVQERFNLIPDPNNYSKFVQEEAALKGAVAAYQFLLDCHENVLAPAISNEDNRA